MFRIRASRKARTGLSDVGLLALRLTTGGLLAGHGSQKLFGWFKGPGRKGTAGWLESIGLRPGHLWGWAAGLSEFGGGVLTALGFLNPLGELGILASMSMATFKAHAGKPIWVTSGGAELPITNIAVVSALILSGPGRLSLDHALGTRLPRWVALPGLAAVGAGVAYGVLSSRAPQQKRPEEAGAALQAGEEVAHPL